MSRVAALLGIVCIALLSFTPGTARSQSYLQTGATAGFNVTPTGFTVECWVKVRSEPGYDPRIIRCIGPTEAPCGNAQVECWELFICKASACTPGQPFFALTHAGVCHELQANRAIVDGAYHHVAATYDGTTMSIYVDGVPSGSLVASGEYANVAGGKLVVGNATAYNNPFDGQIDEVRVWSLARTPGQIASAMSTEIVPQSGLAGYWRLNGDGTDLIAAATLVPSGVVAWVPGELNQAADVSNSSGGGGGGGGAAPATSPQALVALAGLLGVVGAVALRGRLEHRAK